MRVVCRDISLGTLPDATYVWKASLLLYSSSCFFDTCEPTPASAGAEGRICVFECAVRTLCSASDILSSVAILKHSPNQHERSVPNMRRGDRKFNTYVVGCRQCKVKEE